MIAFVGLSHLGIVHAAATAAKGWPVTGFDADATLCASLNDARLPISEPGLQELFSENRERLEFTSDFARLAGSELVIFSLDVATDDQNRSDLRPLLELIDLAVPHLNESATVVVLSQVPPGFARSLHARKLGRSLHSQVETLIFGNAVERALKPERFIVGCADPRQALPAPYAKWLAAFGCPVLPMRYESAELAKIAINCFLVSSISTANTLAELCERTGADWSEIAPALRLDRRIGPHACLTPGLGIAGGNLERDLVTVRSLAAEHGTEASVVSAWQLSSRHRRDWALRKLQDLLFSKVANPRLAIWGLTYKPDTASLKNSPSLALIEALAQFDVTAYDPMVQSPPAGLPHLTLAASALEACRATDALIVMTPWRQFSSVDPRAVRQAMHGNLLIDPFGVVEGDGFSHHQLGS